MSVISTASTRIKNATRELLGIRHKRIKIRPRSFEEQLYVSLIEAGDICIDVGANVGNVSMLLARLTGKDGLVVAFEPLWPMYVELCKRIRMTGFAAAPIITMPYGLAEVEKAATIQVPGNIFGMGSLASATAWANTLGETQIVPYECNFIKLDSFCKTSNVYIPDFIKIDVEGAELFVLQGASDIFENGLRPLMLIELFAPWERAFKYGPWEVLGYLDSLGYLIFFMCPGALVEYKPTKEEPFPIEYVNGYNIIVMHPDIHANRIARVKHYCSLHGANIMPMPPPPMKNTLG